MLNSIFDRLPCSTDWDVTDQQTVILQQIESIKQKMKLAETLFDMSDDDALTDACIYQIKALGSYYHYLMAEARRCGCHCTAVEKQPAALHRLKAAGML